MSTRGSQLPLDKPERGASAILIAISMIVLMGFAAVAIDSGIAFDERRQQQSGADVGALAAAQFADRNLPTGNATCAPLTGKNYAACRGAEEAMDVVDGTLPGTYSAADWLACSDPSKPAKFSQGSTLSPCINFTDNFQETRVVLPGVQVDTTFGAIIGLNQIPVGAWAEVGLDIDQSADVLPWAVGPTGSGSNYGCLFANSSSNLNVDPCNGPAGGNFGKLDVSLYRNYTMGTPKICGNAQTQVKMAVNLITGADHLLEEETAYAGVVNDWTNCDNHGTSVDELRVQTGNAESGIKDGMFIGTTATDIDYEGRLLCKNGAGAPAGYTEYGTKNSPACITIGNQFPEQVDHTPLWDFIKNGVSQTWPTGSECVDTQVDTWLEMKDCLQGWRDYVTNVGPHVDGSGNLVTLFEFGLQEAPRFAAVPILNMDPSGGSGDYMITAFKPVFIDTTYLKCNANTCDIAHSPGLNDNVACPNPITSADRACGYTANGNKAITAVTSYMLTIDMLDEKTQENFPNVLGTKVYNLKR